jgi:peptide deformylase
MIRPILRYGEAVLQTTARPVDEITSEVESLIDDMIQTMYAAPGVGLAAPQVGVPLRIFVADVSGGRNAPDLLTFVNPQLLETEGTQHEDEGCLSLPGFTSSVARPTRAVVKGLDRNGREQVVEGTGLLARCLLHELDHLDGRLFVDHLHGLKRELILRRVRKLSRSGKW